MHVLQSGQIYKHNRKKHNKIITLNIELLWHHILNIIEIVNA